MTKKVMLEVSDCSQCPSFDTRWEGRVMGVPYCCAVKKVLPYTEHASIGAAVAVGDNAIPDWCPLPDFGEQK